MLTCQCSAHAVDSVVVVVVNVVGRKWNGWCLCQIPLRTLVRNNGWTLSLRWCNHLLVSAMSGSQLVQVGTGLVGFVKRIQTQVQ